MISSPKQFKSSASVGRTFGMAMLGVFAFLLYLSMGAVSLPLSETFQVLLHLLWQSEAEVRAEFPKTTAILIHIRLPRGIAAILAGSALGLAGAAMQGLFRNPMASPDIMGVTAGSSLGAVIAIGTGIAVWHPLMVPAISVVFALATALFVYLIAGRNSINLLVVILSGMAVSSLLGGAISAVLLFSQQYEVAQFIFWTMGGLEGRMWQHIVPVLPFILISMMLLMRHANALNVISLGDENAHGMGLNVAKTKLIVLLLTAIVTALAISIAGPIAFVGLMVPHIVRLLGGPNHKRVLPYSAYVGALMVMLSDWLGRVIIAPHEIKVGIITAVIGGSYFIFLIVRLQRTGKLL